MATNEVNELEGAQFFIFYFWRVKPLNFLLFPLGSQCVLYHTPNNISFYLISIALSFTFVTIIINSKGGDYNTSILVKSSNKYFCDDAHHKRGKESDYWGPHNLLI
jgi:hypothetical protein